MKIIISIERTQKAKAPSASKSSFIEAKKPEKRTSAADVAIVAIITVAALSVVDGLVSGDHSLMRESVFALLSLIHH